VIWTGGAGLGMTALQGTVQGDSSEATDALKIRNSGEPGIRHAARIFVAGYSPQVTQQTFAKNAAVSTKLGKEKQRSLQAKGAKPGGEWRRTGPHPDLLPLPRPLPLARYNISPAILAAARGSAANAAISAATLGTAQTSRDVCGLAKPASTMWPSSTRNGAQ
jgi:hypothetical protein